MSASCILQLDAERCSFCEFCVRRCPTQAFRVEIAGDQASLYFTASACTFCAPEEGCEAVCPEKAIRYLGPGQAEIEAGERRLASSALLSCAYCGQRFAPLLKLEALSQEGRAHTQPVRDLCPVCRRKHLVVKFIEEKRLPGAKAEYRSGKDIVRRAGYGPGKAGREP